MPFESNYQDLNDANNPPSSESNEDGNNKGTKEKKEKDNHMSQVQRKGTKRWGALEASMLFSSSKPT